MHNQKDVSILFDKIAPKGVNRTTKSKIITVGSSTPKNNTLDVETVDTKISNSTIEKLISQLLDNSKFLNYIDESIKIIFPDGKLHTSNVPELVFLIIDAYNTVGSVKVPKEDLSKFVKIVFEFIVEKYKLLSQDKIDKYESIILSSIKLLLLTPQVANKRSFRSFFGCC